MSSIIQKLWLIISVLCAAISANAYDFEVDGIYYDIVSFTDFTCEVVQSPAKDYTGDFVVPENVSYKNRQLKVISIGESAFAGCSSLKSINIPNSVKEIGKSAFAGCSSLISIDIPNSVRWIRENAFYGCSSLTSIDIPNSVTWISSNTFYYCSSLTSIDIPNSVKEIGGSAFAGCSSLKSINIPNSVKEIWKSAFAGCSSLTSINIPNSVTEIGDGVFSGCSSLTSINIPNSVTTLGYNAFYDCSSLENIQLSDQLTKLYCGTFYGCTSLSSLTIPGKITEMMLFDGRYYDQLFYNCYKLNELKIGYGPEILSARCGSGNSHCDLVFCSIINEANYISSENEPLPIQKVTIDRELSNYIRLDSLKHYTMGEHIMKNQVMLSYSEDLESITCYAKNPPALGGVTKLQYTDVIVKVPKESLDAYKNADGWKNFWNIEGIDDEAGINDVLLENDKIIENYIVYNLQGVMVLKTANREDVMQLPSGLYIVNGKKIVVR